MKRKTPRETDEEILSRPLDYVAPSVVRRRQAFSKGVEAMILAVQWQNMVKEKTDVLFGIIKKANVGKVFLKALRADLSEVGKQ